jgi:hypothetical protein
LPKVLESLGTAMMAYWSVEKKTSILSSLLQYSNTLSEPEANPPKLTEFESSHDGSPYFWAIDPIKGRLKMLDYGKNIIPCQPVSGLKKWK